MIPSHRSLHDNHSKHRMKMPLKSPRYLVARCPKRSGIHATAFAPVLRARRYANGYVNALVPSTTSSRSRITNPYHSVFRINPMRSKMRVGEELNRYRLVRFQTITLWSLDSHWTRWNVRASTPPVRTGSDVDSGKNSVRRRMFTFYSSTRSHESVLLFRGGGSPVGRCFGS